MRQLIFIFDKSILHKYLCKIIVIFNWWIIINILNCKIYYENYIFIL